jgi:hypothetical protein
MFRGEYEKAIESYKTALQHIKTDPYVMGALFSLLTQLGQFERGIEVFCLFSFNSQNQKFLLFYVHF